MDSYTEVRRVRKEMSERAGHDIRRLIASINERWADDDARAIEPRAMTEQHLLHDGEQELRIE